MSPEPETCSPTFSWALKPAMSASPLPWMESPLRVGILTLIRGLPWKFRLWPSIEMRSVSSSIWVTRCRATSESISRVTWKAPGRTSTSTGAARSILVKPDRVRVSPAKAGRATVQAARASGRRRIPGLRPVKLAISGPHCRPGLAGQGLEKTVEHRERRLEAGEPLGQQGVGVPAGAPEILAGALDPVPEAVRAELGVELDADRPPHPVALRWIGLAPEELPPGNGLEGVAVPVDGVEDVRERREERVLGWADPGDRPDSDDHAPGSAEDGGARGGGQEL